MLNSYFRAAPIFAVRGRTEWNVFGNGFDPHKGNLWPKSAVSDERFPFVFL
jgi:hypothetical protein